MEEINQHVKYNKGMFILLSGIIAIVASQVIDESSEIYGFLIGYGYTAVMGGIAGLLVALVQNKRLRKRNKLNL